MKMLLIVCPESRRERVRKLVAAHDVHAYSEIGRVTGEGLTGKKFGDAVWPGESVLLFTVVRDEKRDELMAALRECEKDLYPEEGMAAFVLSVEEVL